MNESATLTVSKEFVNDAETDTTLENTQETHETHDAAWYTKSAYECFIKNADKDTSDADPIAAIQRVFDQRASDELKAQVAAEGKTAEGAYQFLWSIARLCKQTAGGCHISPETGYAIAMHYFQDVPASVLDEFEPALQKQKEERETAERNARSEKAAAEAKERAKKKQKSKKNATADKQHTTTVASSEHKPVGESTKASPKPQKAASLQQTMFDKLFA